jgi:hypothetical protein
MDRPFIEATIGELEEIFDEHVHKRPVLAKLKEELDHRSTDRAQQLRTEVQGVLDGDIPIRKPPPEDSPDYQMTLEDLLGRGDQAQEHER